jgi:hypothetical protein
MENLSYQQATEAAGKYLLTTMIQRKTVCEACTTFIAIGEPAVRDDEGRLWHERCRDHAEATVILQLFNFRLDPEDLTVSKENARELCTRAKQVKDTY